MKHGGTWIDSVRVGNSHATAIHTVLLMDIWLVLVVLLRKQTMAARHGRHDHSRILMPKRKSHIDSRSSRSLVTKDGFLENQP